MADWNHETVTHSFSHHVWATIYCLYYVAVVQVVPLLPLQSLINTTSIPSFAFAAEADSASRQKSGGQQPIFRAGVCLSIPNIVMMPALEGIQQALNKAVEYVVSVSKGVGQWSKERISKVVLLLRSIIKKKS